MIVASNTPNAAGDRRSVRSRFGMRYSSIWSANFVLICVHISYSVSNGQSTGIPPKSLIINTADLPGWLQYGNEYELFFIFGHSLQLRIFKYLCDIYIA